IVAGLVVTAAATRVLGSLLYGVSPLDTATYLAVPALLAVVSAVAAYGPTRRALGVDPMAVLRQGGLSQLPQDETLQIVGLRHGHQHGMISALHPFLDDDNVAAGVHRGRRQHVGERRLADVVGAAAGHEEAARPEQLERAEVDLLVAGER